MSGLVNVGMDKGLMMESEDRIEKTVDIYISAETVRDMKHKKDTGDFNTSKTQTPQHTGSVSVRNRSSRAAAVCLVLLCVLLLTAVIVLCVMFTQERQQFISKNENLTNERVQLISKNENLTNERVQLISKDENLTNEKVQLISKNENLTNERDQLKVEKNDLQRSLGKMDGWIYYQSSFYFNSPEEKNWTDSKRYCTERGADLIIINNTEEQDFVKNISNSGLVWIGLTDSDEEGRWKWVDGTNMTSGFWMSGEPNSKGGDEDCVLTYSPGWADYPCNYRFRWICEKIMFN